MLGKNSAVCHENSFTIHDLSTCISDLIYKLAQAAHTHTHIRMHRNAFVPIDCGVSERALIVGTITSERNIRFQRWVSCFKVTSPLYAAHTDITINGSALINATWLPFDVKKESRDGCARGIETTYSHRIAIKIVINVWQ